ncbi:hypothetical protein yc1106_08317 [Curvularia clavata]|uniref:WH2 domain-containing protein n=1 Tax=Curvularia clavata TaxID=95742 RepID=A0A9Q8ZHX0_CURCL|nr:hypothetical protein yc1106_08317 [Curvularia clavata]
MPDNDQYRRAVQDRVEELLSKRHNTSPSQLLVEAMVGGMKLYLSYKEQGKEEQRKKQESDEKRGQGRHRKESHMDEKEKYGHRRRHKRTHGERSDGSKNGRRHQHRGRSRNRGHRRQRDVSHGRHCSSSQDKYNGVSSRVHHDRSRSRDGGSNHRQRDETDNVHDSITTSIEESGLMSGANGYQTLAEDLISRSHPHSVSDQGRAVLNPRTTPALDQLETNALRIHSREYTRSPELDRAPGLKTRRVIKPHNTHQRGGEKNPPSRYQSSAHQRHSVTWAEKSGASQSSVQQRDPDGTPFGSLPRYESKAGIALGLHDYFVNTYKQIKAEQDAGYRTKGLIEKVLEGTRMKWPDGKTNKGKPGPDRKAPQQYPREGEHRDNNDKVRLMHAQPNAVHIDDTSAPPMEEPHSPAEPEMNSGTSCPIMAHAPLPLPRPLLARDANKARTALLDSIQAGVRLCRVASLDKKDKSASSSAGKVLYKATEHSQEVEEQERAPAAQEAQAEGETDPGPEPNRAFREDLLNALEGRKARLGGTSHAA